MLDRIKETSISQEIIFSQTDDGRLHVEYCGSAANGGRPTTMTRKESRNHFAGYTTRKGLQQWHVVVDDSRNQ